MACAVSAVFVVWGDCVVAWIGILGAVIAPFGASSARCALSPVVPNPPRQAFGPAGVRLWRVQQPMELLTCPPRGMAAKVMLKDLTVGSGTSGASRVCDVPLSKR